MNHKITFWLMIVSAITTSVLAESDKEQLASFIQSPPPIREMIVEYNWYAHNIGKTNTNWLALSWQTNGYVFRKSKQRTALFDLFNTNYDELITIRSNDTYSAVLISQWMGLHVETAQGTNSGERDLIRPKILGQEVVASYALAGGIDGSIGAIVLTDNSFAYNDESRRRNVSGALEIDPSGRINGINVTNNVFPVTLTNENGEMVNIKGGISPGTLTYKYGGTDLPVWFPHEITRVSVVDGQPITVYRIEFHRLELGFVPIADFYPERFLKAPSADKIVTSNGVSFVTLGGITKPILDPHDDRASKAVEEKISHTVRPVFIVILLLSLAFPVFAILRGRKKGGL
jgi:hypothetical protein